MNDMTMAVLGVTQSANEMAQAWKSLDSNLALLVRSLHEREKMLVMFSRLYPKLSTLEVIQAVTEHMAVDRGAAQ